MISLIVSSYKEKDFKRFSESVAQTIGVPFEIIQISNPGLMGICQAYNRGAAQAKYPYLCFVHEDVEFTGQDWGKNILNIFQEDETIVLAGLAGSRYKPDFVTGWSMDAQNLDRVKITHVDASGEAHLWINNPLKENYSETRTLDGVFLFTKQTIWRQHPFNEDISGFHFYDLEYSLRLDKIGKVVVVYCVDLNHHSRGNFDNVWLDAAFDFHQKYQSLIAGNSNSQNIHLSLIETIKIKQFWRSCLLKSKTDQSNKFRVILYYRQCFHWMFLLYTLGQFSRSSLLRFRERAGILKRRFQRG